MCKPVPHYCTFCISYVWGKLQTSLSSITLWEIKAYTKLSFHPQVAPCLLVAGVLENDFSLLSVLYKSYIISLKISNRKGIKRKINIYIYRILLTALKIYLHEEWLWTLLLLGMDTKSIITQIHGVFRVKTFIYNVIAYIAIIIKPKWGWLRKLINLRVVILNIYVAELFKDKKICSWCFK